MTVLSEKIDLMIHELLEAIDYDIAKEYDEEIAEEPELIEENMDELRAIVLKYFS